MNGVRIGYWTAQEQYSPSRLLDHAAAAARGGFDDVFTSDHFMPWFDSGAQSGFTWAWMGACGARNASIRMGTAVTAPDRYHPALIAQAFATLDDMFPGRIALGLGAGEAMNSTPLGIDFPVPGQRVQRLRESLEIIKGLWAGKTMDYPGFFFRLRGARLYTAPKTRIPILVAAGGKETARLAGKYADGVIGFSGGADLMAAAVGSARKCGKEGSAFERLIEFKCSYDEDYQKALDSVKVWRSTMVKGVLGSSLADPRRLEERGAEEVTDKEIESAWAIVTKAEDLIAPIKKVVGEGFTAVEVHSSSPDEQAFIRELVKVLPALRAELQ